MKSYSQSPLPFQGQKRNFVKAFRESLTHYSDAYTYVDLFGGSGLLGHTVKTVFPNAKVVFNDYDNFKQRLKSIEKTNKLPTQLRRLARPTRRFVSPIFDKSRNRPNFGQHHALHWQRTHIRKQHKSNRTNTERRKAQTNFKHLSFFVQMVLNKCTFGFGDYTF